MTRNIRSFVEHTDFDLSHHIAFWEEVNRLLPPGALEADGELGSIWDNAVPIKQPPLAPSERTEWITKIKALNLSQPDAVTCQSACIGMAVGDPNVQSIRRKLRMHGDAGSPDAMGRVIRSYGRPYQFVSNASLSDVYSWLKAGEFLITHGWFTGSGHVICLDGLRARSPVRYSINVKDPWSEFNAATWRYDLGGKFYDGFYSDGLIYATCVAGSSSADAWNLYKRGSINTAQKGMWVHRFLVS